MTNPDSLQAICAELRATGQSESIAGRDADYLIGIIDRLERLDAEMRKEVDDLRNERDDYRASLYDETDGITGTLRKDELAELRARLAAYEQFYEGVTECMEDTWQCEGCGRAEPWWTESNADYATRKSVAAIAPTPTAPPDVPGGETAPPK